MAQKHPVNPVPVAKKRAPNGLDSDKPVAVRFTKQELKKLREVATSEQRTMASVARLATLRGLAEYEKDPRALLAASDS